MFRKSKSPFRQAIDRGMRPGGDLGDELVKLGMYEIKSRADAKALCETLVACVNEPPSETRQKRIRALAGKLQYIESHKAHRIVRNSGVPALRKLLADQLGASAGTESTNAEDTLFYLKLCALYDDGQGLQLLPAFARDPRLNNGDLWPVVFSALDATANCAHVIDALRNPLPDRLAGVAYLNLVNMLARGNPGFRHPFDSEDGVARLRAMLQDTDEEQSDRAVSAVAAIPFLDSGFRDELMAAADTIPDHLVRIEAARVQAAVGQERGLNTLTKYCLDLNYCTEAKRYLRVLGREDRIPPAAEEPDFMAMSTMACWLSHPNLFGRPPTKIELYDTRKIFWPPTNDVHQVWLFRYTYEKEDDGDQDEIGIGMLGSITFALFRQRRAELCPEDVYALHCCQELRGKGDPRAPGEITVEAGRKLLGF